MSRQYQETRSCSQVQASKQVPGLHWLLLVGLHLLEHFCCASHQVMMLLNRATVPFSSRQWTNVIDQVQVSCLNFDITASPKFFRVFFSTIKPKIATVAHLLPVAVWIKRIFWNTGWIARVACQPVPARPAEAAATSATLTFKHQASS